MSKCSKSQKEKFAGKVQMPKVLCAVSTNHKQEAES
jgi:hypothetical protein